MTIKSIVKPLVTAGILAAAFVSASAFAHGGNGHHHDHHDHHGHHGGHYWHRHGHFRPVFIGGHWRPVYWHPYRPVYWPAPGFRVVIR